MFGNFCLYYRKTMFNEFWNNFFCQQPTIKYNVFYGIIQKKACFKEESFSGNIAKSSSYLNLRTKINFVILQIINKNRSFIGTPTFIMYNFQWTRERRFALSTNLCWVKIRKGESLLWLVAKGLLMFVSVARVHSFFTSIGILTYFSKQVNIC